MTDWVSHLIGSWKGGGLKDGKTTKGFNTSSIMIILRMQQKMNSLWVSLG